MSNVINFNLVKTIKVPNEIMLIEAGPEWAKAMDEFLSVAGMKKGKEIFFKIGEVKKGKFKPYEDMGVDADYLFEAYSFMVKTNFMTERLGLYACQTVESVKDLRS